jgi:hypothetical protein
MELEKMSVEELREGAFRRPESGVPSWSTAFDELASRLKEAEAREAVMVEALQHAIVSMCVDCYEGRPWSEQAKGHHHIGTFPADAGHFNRACKALEQNEVLSLTSPRAKQILAVVEAAFQWERTTWKDDISVVEDKLREAIRSLK